MIKDINKILAEWCWPIVTWVVEPDQYNTKGLIAFYRDADGNEDSYGTSELFTESIDACFEHLISKIKTLYGLSIVWVLLKQWVFEECMLYSTDTSPAATLSRIIEKFIRKG